tara:strand:- start:28 stop:300 length:273 start_codon:yes stop_codon:yes gene_type:complete
MWKLDSKQLSVPLSVMIWQFLVMTERPPIGKIYPHSNHRHPYRQTPLRYHNMLGLLVHLTDVSRKSVLLTIKPWVIAFATNFNQDSVSSH